MDKSNLPYSSDELPLPGTQPKTPIPHTCPQCGSADIIPHCNGNSCDSIVCTGCNQQVTHDGLHHVMRGGR